jgi:hypothetical protein
MRVKKQNPKRQRNRRRTGEYGIEDEFTNIWDNEFDPFPDNAVDYIGVETNG